MSLASLINRECVLLLRDASGTVDVYGNDVPDEATEVTVCELQPRRASEGDAVEEISEDDYVAYFLPGTDLSTADAVVVDGSVFEFTGKPPVWRNPRTQGNVYVEAFVRRTAGSGDVS